MLKNAKTGKYHTFELNVHCWHKKRKLTEALQKRHSNSVKKFLGFNELIIINCSQKVIAFALKNC